MSENNIFTRPNKQVFIVKILYFSIVLQFPLGELQ
jgi:hypothetical protein